MGKYKILVLAIALLGLQGCAAVALTLGGTAAKAGIEHALNSVSDKTFANSLTEMKLATLDTLQRMDMEITDMIETSSGVEILAEAKTRSISVELEYLTHNTTRMEVSANRQFLFFKDKATAVAITEETGLTLALNEADNYATASGPQ